MGRPRQSAESVPVGAVAADYFRDAVDPDAAIAAYREEVDVYGAPVSDEEAEAICSLADLALIAAAKAERAEHG